MWPTREAPPAPGLRSAVDTDSRAAARSCEVLLPLVPARPTEVSDGVSPLVPVRDSKAPGRGELVFSDAAWAAFVADVAVAGS
ncbi:DUF397 domain-containing protein [Streptomyces canus]|uniref:DUF397 domain-containing protein n=1 Tax=Streptomyces canus TaxID=58343 RepID=UPI003864A166